MEVGVVHGYSGVIPTQPPKGSKMNIAKNMEAIAIVAIALACVTTYAIAGKPETARVSAAQVGSDHDATIPTVTVIGKRPTAAEKAQFVR